ncbi:hypothetical protein PRIPAC_91342 [Pristionchus pacificus]|nr:hypothetical protein PRIPAC_91342 [Pristionchus pacificus]|eukprot:PDM61419.1 hypothetical protein PRIPAC_50861 [Pristionchus pacificus]
MMKGLIALLLLMFVFTSSRADGNLRNAVASTDAHDMNNAAMVASFVGDDGVMRAERAAPTGGIPRGKRAGPRGKRAAPTGPRPIG